MVCGFECILLLGRGIAMTIMFFLITGDLDETFLQQIGWLENISFINIMNSNNEENDEEINTPQLIIHSPYYDWDTPIATLVQKKKEFRNFNTNIQSIHVKIDELRIFIKQLKLVNYEFSAIVIQESWLADGADTSQIQLNDYTCIPQGKASSSKGGLIIYLHKTFDYVYKTKLSHFVTWEGQIVQVKKGEYLAKPITIGNIYNPPKALVDNYTQFIEEFAPILNSLQSNNQEVIIASDFNIDLL